MWNGFWKLTVMVSVIGAGLFAVYTAQKGMNLPSPFAAIGSDSGSAETSSADAGTPSRSQDASGISELPAFDDTSVASMESRKPRPPASDDWNLPDSEQKADQSPRPAKKKSGLLANRSEVKTATVSLSQLDDSNTDREPAVSLKSEDKDDTSSPSELSFSGQDEPADNSSQRETITQTSAQDDNEPTLKVPSKLDSFESDPVDNNAKENEKPLATPARLPNGKVVKVFAKETNPQPADDFDSAPPPILSNRAKRNSSARAHAAADSEADTPKAEEEPAKESAQATTPEEVNPIEEAPELSVPPKNDDPEEAAPVTTRNSRKDAERRPTSADTTSSRFYDDEKKTDATTVRSRRETPVQLPPEINAEPMPEVSSRKQSTATNRSDDQRVTTAGVRDQDMIGDGVVGDPALRGVQQPRLTIEKVAAQQAVIEQPLVYTIIVRNTGNVDAHNIIIEDRIPKGTELLGTSPQAELSGKRLTWNHGTLKPNEEKKISIKVLPKQEGPIGSVARVYFATEVTAEIVVSAPQLEFTVKAPSEVRLDQRFELVFNLKNVGKVDASNIIVRDLVPAELKNDSGADIECPVGKLAPGETREIVLPVSATTTGTAHNRAILTADTGIKKTLDSNIDIVGEVLVLTRTGQNRLYVERPVVFTNSVRNDGNQAADSVNLSEVVPAGMQFDSASHGGRFDPKLRSVVWAIGSLAPGADKQVTVKYVPRETGVHSAKITATGAAGSTASVNAPVEVVGKPELQMETMSATGIVTVGDRITSRFQLNNTGTAPATGVQLRVKLPAELKLISANKGAKFQQRDGEIIFESIPELPPGKKTAFEMVLEPVDEADAQIVLEIAADHLLKPGRRIETIQIARDGLN